MKTEKYAIGVDLGGTTIKYAIVDSNGKIIASYQADTESEKGRGQVLDNIIKCINRSMAFCAEEKISVEGVGIGTPGIIDNGLVLGGAENLPDWESLPLSGMLTRQTGLSVFVDNDANLMGLAEVRYGSAKGTLDAIFLTIGTGVGGAMVLNGKLYGGHRNRGAELGHIIVEPNGEKCSCGTTGCLEAHASVTALIRDYKDAIGNRGQKIDGKYIVERYHKKDKIAIHAFNRHFDYLAFGIAGFINIFSPQKVVIGGGISEAGTFYIENVRKRAMAITMKETSVFTNIEKAQLGNKAGFMGAAALVFDNVSEKNAHDI